MDEGPIQDMPERTHDARSQSQTTSQNVSRQRQIDAGEALRAAFHHFDRDADGVLDLDELVFALGVVGHPMSRRQARSFMRATQATQTDTVSLEHFGVMFSQLASKAPQARLRSLFHELDTDGDGRISTRELTRVIEAAGLTLSPRIIASLMAEGDDHGDGHIHLDAFCRVMGFDATRTGGEGQAR